MTVNRAYPQIFVTVDTETTVSKVSDTDRSETHSFKLGSFFINIRNEDNTYTTTKYRFDNLDTFYNTIDKIQKIRGTVYIFAHNAGFDSRILALYDQIDKGRYNLLPPILSSSNFKAKVPLAVFENPPFLFGFYRNDNQRFIFTDTVQLFFSSLKSLGDQIGLPKLDVDFSDVSDEELAIYCERDVEILNTYLINHFNYLSKYSLGSFQTTLASQAMHSFRRMKPIPKIVRHEIPDLTDFERRSYFGGRLEVYKHGLTMGPIFKTDVNSLYPYVMKKYLYPVELLEARSFHKPIRPISDIDYAASIAEVTLDCDGEPYPLKFRDGVNYVNGRFQTVLSGPELERAYRSNHITHIHRILSYRMENIFTAYINKFWDLKRRAEDNNDKVGREIAKRFLVSLYGKFAQRFYNYIYDPFTKPLSKWGEFKIYDAESNVFERYRTLSGRVEEQIEQGDAKTAFTPIAAFVTSYARERMVQLRHIAGKDQTLYQATDSLFLLPQGYQNLTNANEINPKALGKLKDEGTINLINIHAYHRYEADDKKIRGGIRAKSKEISDWEYDCDHFESLKTALKNDRLSIVKVSKVKKVLGLNFSRGNIGKFGYTTPFILNEPDKPSRLWLAAGIAEILPTQ